MSHTEHDIINANGNRPANVPDPEVVAKPERRRFTAEYKQRLLREADACREPGALGALLRREGLYSSHLTTWRRQRERGERQGLAATPRGRKATPEAVELAQVRHENDRLRAQLERAETILDVQKKLSQLLGLPTPTKSDER